MFVSTRRSPVHLSSHHNHLSPSITTNCSKDWFGSTTVEHSLVSFLQKFGSFNLSLCWSENPKNVPAMYVFIEIITQSEKTVNTSISTTFTYYHNLTSILSDIR